MFQESGLNDTLFLVHLTERHQSTALVFHSLLFPSFPFRALTERKIVRKHSFCTNAHQDIPLHMKPSKPNTELHQLINTRQKRRELKASSTSF